MKDYVTTILMSLIFASVPSKAHAKDLVTSGSPSSICLTCGYPSINFFPFGSVLTMTLMLVKFYSTIASLTGFWNDISFRNMSMDESEMVNGNE